MSKPRKFTLQYSGDYWFENDQTYVGDPDKEYHVIEYSAYKSLEQQLEIALKALESCELHPNGYTNMTVKYALDKISKLKGGNDE